MPTEIHVFLGNLENPEEFPAQLQVFCAVKTSLAIHRRSDPKIRRDTRALN